MNGMNVQKMTVDLYGATIARMEGQTFASLFVGQPVLDEQEENAKGIVLMKLPCDEEVYNSLKSHAYPCPVVLTVRLKKAAGGKMGQHCVQLDLVKQPPGAPSKAA